MDDKLPIPIDRTAWPINERALDLRRDRAVINPPTPAVYRPPLRVRLTVTAQVVGLWAALYGTAFLIGHFWPW